MMQWQEEDKLKMDEEERNIAEWVENRPGNLESFEG
jgi:hypothetical protein